MCAGFPDTSPLPPSSHTWIKIMEAPRYFPYLPDFLDVRRSLRIQSSPGASSSALGKEVVENIKDYGRDFVIYPLGF